MTPALNRRPKQIGYHTFLQPQTTARKPEESSLTTPHLPSIHQFLLTTLPSPAAMSLAIGKIPNPAPSSLPPLQSLALLAPKFDKRILHTE